MVSAIDVMQKQFRNFLLQLWKVYLQHEIVHDHTRHGTTERGVGTGRARRGDALGTSRQTNFSEATKVSFDGTF